MEIPDDKIILLDLNYTLVKNSSSCHGSYPQRIYQQTYEEELLKMIEKNYVILITARPEKFKKETMKHIEKLTGFTPKESYWNWVNDYSVKPPEVKKYWMEKEIIPKHGKDTGKYLAIESNPKTREMYAKLGIEAHPKKYYLE